MHLHIQNIANIFLFKEAVPKVSLHIREDAMDSLSIGMQELHGLMHRKNVGLSTEETWLRLCRKAKMNL